MKKKRSKRAKVKRIAAMKRNPSGGLLDIGKKAIPGGAALLATLFTTSRLEALAAGNVMAPAPAFAAAGRVQKIIALVAPLAMLALAHFATKRVLQKHRVSILVGAGTAAALRYLGIGLAYMKARQLAAAPPATTSKPQATGAHEPTSFFGLPSAQITSRVQAVENDDDPVDPLEQLSLDGDSDPQFSDLYSGNFGAN